MKRAAEIFRKFLFSVDITVLFVAVIFTVHYWWTINALPLYVMFILYLLVMRMNISLMLYRGKCDVMSMLAFFVLGLLCIDVSCIDSVSEKFVKIVFLLLTSGTDGSMLRESIDGLVPKYGYRLQAVASLWVFVFPIFVAFIRFLLQFIRRLPAKNKYNMFTLKHIGNGIVSMLKKLVPDWKLSFVRHDPLGKIIILFLFVALLASFVGEEMSFLPSLVSTICLPCLLLVCIRKLCSKAVSSKEIWIMLVGAMLFWHAQYHTGNVRLVLLSVNVILVGYACVLLEKQIRNRVLSLMAFVFAAFLIPTLSLGYIQYTVLDAVRVNRFKTYVSTNGVLYVKSENGYGLRDRYGIVVPCEYSNITPCGADYRQVLLEKSNEKKLYNLWQNKETKRHITINNDWQNKAESLLRHSVSEYGFDFGQVVVIEAESGNIKVMSSIGDSKAHSGKSYMTPWEFSYTSGLVRPFVYLAALNAGNLKPADSFDIDKSVSDKQNRNCLYSDISAYNLAKNAFGSNADSLYMYLKEYGADREITLNDEYLARLINIRPQVTEHYNGTISDLTNGYGLKFTALQLAGMYSLFGRSKHSQMKLYAADNEKYHSDIVDFTSEIESVRAMMSSGNWNEDMARELKPDSVELSGYASMTRQNNSDNEKDDIVCTGFCGYFIKDGLTYVICTLMEKTGQSCSVSHLKGIVPGLADYIYNSKQSE